MQAVPPSTLEFEDRNGLGVLTLLQAPSNRMSRQFFLDFAEWMHKVQGSASLRGLVIHGSGRHFSQGADIDDLLEAFEGSAETSFFEDNRRSFQQLTQLKIPVIAAIQGVCLGSALELALSCHFRFCATGALLALPETNFNLMPGCGGTQRLQELCGKNKALELMLEGRNFSAEEALQWGIVDKVVDKKDLMDQALAFAAKIATDYQKDKRSYYIKHV